MAKKMSGASLPTGPAPSEAFAIPAGDFDVASVDPRATPIGPQDKEGGQAALAGLGEHLAGLQERLFAQSTSGNSAAVLLILQGMDTSGKDGTINHVLGLVDPGGVRMAAFKKPTEEELAHDFLWRIEKEVPAPGYIGVFNRSQYEDVLVARVRELVPEDVWRPRFSAINDFEQGLVARGVTVLKCFLHISREEQKQRLLDRLNDPTKYWKYNPGDVDERGYWDRYQAAYSEALRTCSTDAAPWYVVPADRKWYRNWAISSLLIEALERINPQYPPADFDIDVEKARVAAS